jgi:hypothetical protein
MPEVLAGDTYHEQLESVPEQSWSTASFLSTAVTGLFGLRIDAEAGTITLAPHLPPDWDQAALRDARAGNSILSFSIRQSLHALTLHVENAGTPQHLLFDPEIPLGAQSVMATAGGRRVPVQLERHEGEEQAMLDLRVPSGSTDVVIRYAGGVAVVMPAPSPSLGNPSTGMKLISMTLDGNVLRLDLNAIPGQENKIQIRTERTIQRAEHAAIHKVTTDVYELTLTPTGTARDGYQHQQVTVTLGH